MWDYRDLQKAPALCAGVATSLEAIKQKFKLRVHLCHLCPVHRTSRLQKSTTSSAGAFRELVLGFWASSRASHDPGRQLHLSDQHAIHPAGFANLHWTWPRRGSKKASSSNVNVQHSCTEKPWHFLFRQNTKTARKAKPCRKHNFSLKGNSMLLSLDCQNLPSNLFPACCHVSSLSLTTQWRPKASTFAHPTVQNHRRERDHLSPGDIVQCLEGRNL